MKTIQLLLILMIVGFSAIAQDKQQLHKSDAQDPILVLNDEIIGSIDLLRKVPSERIIEINIHREEQLNTTENLFHDSSDRSGLVVAKIDFDFETKTQEEINTFFGLDPGNALYVNGYLLENKQYRISSASIAKIEIIESDNVLDKRVLNITVF